MVYSKYASYYADTEVCARCKRHAEKGLLIDCMVRESSLWKRHQSAETEEHGVTEDKKKWGCMWWVKPIVPAT